MSAPVVITFVRHGEPEGPANIFRGRTDSALTERGWAQLDAALAGAADFTTIATSPLRRCAAFANRFGERSARTPLVIDELAEMDFGAWDGLAHDDIRARFGPDVDRFRDDPTAVAPLGGESFAEFVARVERALGTLQTLPGPVLAITHAGVMRAALAHCLGLAPAQWNRIALGYAARARISYLAGSPPILLDLVSNTAGNS